jgi:Fur family ferric uptake transcriptional regulator
MLVSHCPTLIHELRARGYRITPQREMIVLALAHAPEHATAEEIYTRVKDQSDAVNIATIYRTLDMLVSEGLASRTNLWNGQAVYVTHMHGPHVHLVCRQCGHVISSEQATLMQLAEELAVKFGFHADIQHVSIAGLCEHCQPIQEKVQEG